MNTTHNNSIDINTPNSAALSKVIKGVKKGRNLFFFGAAVGAGLSNGLLISGVIQGHTFGWYGGLVGFGVTTAIIGLIVILAYSYKMPRADYSNSENYDSYNILDELDKSSDEYFNHGTLAMKRRGQL